MADSTRKRIKDICQRIAECGGVVTAVIDSKHVKIKFTNQRGEHRMIVIGRSPSDHRMAMNIEKDLRRLFA